MKPRLFVCNVCGYEDEYDTEEHIFPCPFCREGKMKPSDYETS